MFWDLFQEIFEVLIRFQVICFCCFRYTVPYRTGLRSTDGIYDLPVLLPETEGADRPFRGLSIYQHKPRYVQDIFILIFCQRALKQRSYNLKYVDNTLIVSDNGITKRR